MVEASNYIFKSYFYDSGTKTIVAAYNGNSLKPTALNSGLENTNLNADTASDILPKTGGITNKDIFVVATLFIVSGSVILFRKK